MKVRSVRLLFVAMLASAVAIVLPAVGIMAADGALAAAQVCGSAGGVNQCTKTTGSGLTLGTLSGWARDDTGGAYTAHEELTGPSGLLKNCGNYQAKNGLTGPTCSYTAGKVAAGNYCSITWFYVGGKWLEKARVCVGVHA
jgi:hypothetical protein